MNDQKEIKAVIPVIQQMSNLAYYELTQPNGFKEWDEVFSELLFEELLPHLSLDGLNRIMEVIEEKSKTGIHRNNSWGRRPELLMKHQEAKKLVDQFGWEGFVEHFNKEFEAQDYRFYACGKAWYDDPEYICKLRGQYGDLLIGWFGVHDQK